MDVDKVLRDSAESVHHGIYSHLRDTNRLEQRIYEKIHGRKIQRKTHFVYAAACAVLAIGISLIVPSKDVSINQSGSERQSSFLENNIIDVNQTVSYSDDIHSPIEQFVLKKISIARYNIQADFQISIKEGYINPQLVNPFLTDENGRKFNWDHGGGSYGNSNEHSSGKILTFIPEGNYDTPPKKITLHFDGYSYDIKKSIGNFTISLNDTYPKKIKLNGQNLTIAQVYYTENEGMVNIKFTHFQNDFIKNLRLRSTTPFVNGAAGGDNEYFTYSLGLPKQEKYTIEAYMVRNTFPKKANIEVDIPNY